MGRQPRPNAAFEEAFAELYPRVRRLAYRLLGDDGLADDVAAETLARLLVHWSRVGQLPYRDGWVLRVGSNLALDHARKRTGDARRMASLLASDETRDANDTVVLRAALVQALTALPRRQREAIVLVYLVGLTPGETARAMSVSSSSVSQHMRRGLDHLRGQLSEGPWAPGAPIEGAAP